MAPHQQRVVDEQKELIDKINKLGKFIVTSDLFYDLDLSEQLRLRHQLRVMEEYSDILTERMKAWA